MNKYIKYHRNGLKTLAVIFSGLLLCSTAAYSHGGGHHGGGHRGGGHHGHHGGWGHHGHHGGWGHHGGYHRGGWGGGGWGGGFYGAGLYGAGYAIPGNGCWRPAHYNRWGRYIPGHRVC